MWLMRKDGDAVNSDHVAVLEYSANDDFEYIIATGDGFSRQLRWKRSIAEPVQMLNEPKHVITYDGEGYEAGAYGT